MRRSPSGGVEREVVVGGVDSGEPLRITAEGLVHVADQVLVDGFKMRHPAVAEVV